MKTVKYQKLEIIAVIVTAAGKFLFYDLLDQRLIFIVLMFAFWSIYISIRIRSSSKVLSIWGFRSDNFGEVLNRVLPFGAIALIACIIIGYTNGTINLHWHILPIFLIYPIFGMLQQFLLMALVAGNLETLKLNKLRIILIVSTLFGLLHYPYPWLMIGTFILSLFYTYIYLKQRNLYVLGLFHGWLGTVFYFTVVNKDPFYEVFKPLLN